MDSSLPFPLPIVIVHRRNQQPDEPKLHSSANC
ncbi:hypothetical protein F8388_024423 [Cannabis sativa]|uniref:Uncharacterized protein n=1 Tax=Cannabis sativa TaxID=3483 RepID=A0A7J6EHF5_CANSA|nr:hypothetical protein F8388_024423 [Cannabis sativa]